MNSFCKTKEKKLTSTDLSKKGSVDEPIRNIIEFINGKTQFVTTSSCSGRIIVLSRPAEEGCNHKKGCNWIFTSHGFVEEQELVEAVIASCYPNAVFKFEPFILHVQCQSLDDAQKLHLVAIESGFRNSGISLSKKGKIMVAVRSTHGLEAPLADGQKILVSNEYLHFLVKKANEKMTENKHRIQKFFDRIQEIF